MKQVFSLPFPLSLPIFLTLLHLLQTPQAYQFSSLIINPDQKTINTATVYQIDFDRTQDNNFNPTTLYQTVLIGPSDTITVTFPASYAMPSGVSCVIEVDGGGQFAPACAVSGRRIVVSGFVTGPRAIGKVSLWVSSITNPSPAILTDYFTGTIGSDTTGPGYYASQVQLEPSTFTSCYSTFAPTTVNSTADMLITLVPTNRIPADGYIVVKFPAGRRWVNDISLTNYFPISAGMACGSRSANVLTSIQCTGDNIQTQVTASNLFASPVSSSFSFSINSFLSPPTNQQSDPLTATSYSPTGQKIDICTFYISDLTPKPLTTITITNSAGSSMVVNQLYTIRFTVTLTDTLAQSDTIKVVFPSGTSMNFTAGTVTSNGSTSGIVSGYETATNTLSMAFVNPQYSFARNQVLYWNVGIYKAPPSIQTTANFLFTVYRNNYPKLEGTAAFSALPGTVTGSISSRLSTTVNANTSYTFSITLADSISSTGRIRLIFPSTITILTSSSSCATVTGTNTVLTPVCTFNTTENSITLSSLSSSSANIDPQTLTIVITGIKNPSSTAPTTTFTLRTYYKTTDATLVATGTMAGITATAALIDNSLVSVTPSSFVVNDVGVSYSLQYKVSNPIPAGGYFTITVPPQITVDTNSAPNSCSINIASTSYIQTSCTASPSASGTVLNFTNPFPSDLTLNTILIARIATVLTNPQSTRPTSSFKLHTYNAGGFEIAFLDSAATVAMVTPASFNSIGIGRASERNYELTSYMLTVGQASVYEGSSVLVITFPSNVVPASTTTCAMTAPSSATLACTYASPQIKITLPSTPIPSGTALKLTLTNIRNPPSFEPTSSFTFLSKTPLELYTYSLQSLTPLLTTSIPTPFQSLSFTFTPAIYSQPASLQINFNPTDSGRLPAKLRVTLANSFVIGGGLVCNSFVDFVGSCTVVVGNTVQVVGNFSSAQMAFSVTGFTAPSAPVSDYSIINTFDNNGYKLDQSTTTILFTISCTLPCRTCTSSALSTQCTSCYNQTSISPMIYLDSALNRCFDICPMGKYASIASYSCLACDSNCLACTGTAVFCLTCNQNTTYKYLFTDTTVSPATQTCLSACPTRMYGNTLLNNQCTACVSPCLTCTSSTACLSCVAGSYLLGTSCGTSCPLGTYIANPTTNNCDPCSTSCLTCQNITTSCTSCTPTLLLYQSQCRSTCPTPLVPQNNTCGPCNPSCLTCITDPYTCTSCNTASSLPYLLNSRCLSTCPETYYRNIGIGACSLCSTVVGLHCSNCSTVSTCLSCDAGFVLFNGSCLGVVPSGFVNVSGVALPCAGDCATCVGNQANCTSCLNNNLLNNICYQPCPTGYVGINKLCQPCTSPCLSCTQTQSTCTSCLSTLSPPVYLTNSRCLPSCPDGTFASNANNTCIPCSSPCQYCTSSLQCLSCLNGFYLSLSSCVTVCPAGFAGVNRLCLACTGNCATCMGETTFCTSCRTNTYLYQLNNSCVDNCGNGLFVDAATQTCVYCTAPCKTCTNTPTTCLSCLTGALYNYRCLSTCPAQYFNQSGVCQQCPSQCSTCTSLTYCSACTSSSMLYNNYCVSTCPPTHSVILAGTCTLCSGSSCHECTSADVCTMCDSGYSLLNGACLGACPASYRSNGTHCVDINQEVLTTENSFPVPFSIAGAVILVACLMSKLQFGKTFLPGAIFSFLGVLECGALGFFLYLYYSNSFTVDPLPFFIGIAALAYMYLLNFLAFMIQNIIFCNDKQFSLWSSHGPNKCSLFWVNLISTLVCHKFRNLLFCKLFTFAVFTAQLESISKFKVLNVFSFLSLLHSGAAIFAVSVAVGSATKQSQLFYECIDVIVLTSLNAILAFFNVVKSGDFFYEMTPEGFELKKKIKAEEDYYENKAEPLGKEMQDEEGFYSNVYHAQVGSSSKQGLNVGLMSTQANRKKYNLYDISSMKDESFGSLAQPQQKRYQNMSVQAVEHLNDSFTQPQQHLDFTAITPVKLQQNSNYTTIFNKSDKAIGVSFAKGSEIGIQNTIDHGPSLRSEGVGDSIDMGLRGRDVSIQPSGRKMVDQSVGEGIQPVDRSVQRTVFWREDQSVQYAESMKTKPPSVQDRSVSNMKVSMKNQSVQQAKSQTSKSIMHQPSMHDQQNQRTIQLHDQQIQNQPSQKSAQIQAVALQSQKGNQHSLSQQEKSIQFQQSIKDKSVQCRNVVQFDQFNQEVYQTRTSEDRVIFQEGGDGRGEGQGVGEAEEGLREEKSDELVLPKEEIRSYQEELEQRIREKQKELTQIKRKVELQQKKNQERSLKMTKKAQYYQHPSSLFDRNERSSANDQTNTFSLDEDRSSLGNGNNAPTNNTKIGSGNQNVLRKEVKQIQEELDAEIDKTIQEIDVVDDRGREGQGEGQEGDGEREGEQEERKIRVQQANISKETEQQFLGMLEQHPNKIIFDNSSDQQQEQTQPNQVFIRSTTNTNIPNIANIGLIQRRNSNKTPQYYQSSAQISSGKDGSTKIHSSSHPLRHSQSNPKKPSAPQIDDSQDNIYDPIIAHPATVYQPRSFSDMSYTIQEMQPNTNLNHTASTYLREESVKTKIRDMLPGAARVRKDMPGERGDREEIGMRRFQSPSHASMPKPVTKGEEEKGVRKSSLMMVGRSQFTEEGLARKQLGRASPLKTTRRWQYENQNRNIEQSGGEEQVVNTRAMHAHLVTPLETDKQVLGFKTSRVQGSEIIRVPNQRKITPREESYGTGMVDQISPFIGEVDVSRLPEKPNVFGRLLEKDKSDFGTEEFEAEPYIEEDPSDEASRYKNNIIIGQMLDRPTNTELKSYYGQKNRRSKQKSSSKNSSFNEFQTETQKIYQQRLNKKR